VLAPVQRMSVHIPATLHVQEMMLLALHRHRCCGCPQLQLPLVPGTCCRVGSSAKAEAEAAAMALVTLRQQGVVPQ
jgi:hypothetical protein